MHRSLVGVLAATALLAALPDRARAVQERVGSGVRVEGAYTAEVMANVRGGVRRGIVGLGNLDAIARLDLGRLLGWSETSVFLYGLATHGGEPTELTGDAQVVSNIEAPDGLRLYEAWVQQNVPRVRLSLLAGLYDVNSEFDVTDEAGLFLNSSFGIGAEFGASGVNGPSIFPVTSLGARAQWHPTHQWYVQGAALDGVPGRPGAPASTAIHISAEDGILWTAEVGFLKHAASASRDGDPRLGRSHVHRGVPWRVAAGLWQYSRPMERIGGTGRVRGHPGAYVLAELRPETDASDGRRRLGLFVRVGLADARTNRFDAYTGAGVTYEGLLPDRWGDVLGLGVASAHNGEAYERTVRASGEAVSDAETTVELTYRLSLGPHLDIQPDVQWVLDPGTDPRRRSALVLGLRVVGSL